MILTSISPQKNVIQIPAHQKKQHPGPGLQRRPLSTFWLIKPHYSAVAPKTLLSLIKWIEWLFKSNKVWTEETQDTLDEKAQAEKYLWRLTLQ